MRNHESIKDFTLIFWESIAIIQSVILTPTQGMPTITAGIPGRKRGILSAWRRNGVLVRPLFPVKEMHHAMKCRGHDQADGDEKHQSGIEGVESRK